MHRTHTLLINIDALLWTHKRTVMLYAVLQVTFFALGMLSMVFMLVSMQTSHSLFYDLVRDTDSDGSDFVEKVEKIKNADEMNQRWVKLWFVLTIVSWVFVGMGKYKEKDDDETKNVKQKE